ncbi:hypothetical protein YSA_05441 [Pseudomonas putida ND6]|uniref:Uncharacterized protein n=1 Tax=Pseudomonas putida ND6 TaxID=231023 RepID=I3UW38_PSEPU|nr:hypothetical protein YSA_05441 [Pseudomonas putida ND6]
MGIVAYPQSSQHLAQIKKGILKLFFSISRPNQPTL